MTRNSATLGAALVALSWVGLALPASASPNTVSDCLAAPGGVWVVVDFQGQLTTGCAINPATGLAALEQVTSVTDPGGFVTQIGGQPSVASSDPFIYWNYWHAGTSGVWGYSTEGAGTYVPRPGTIEGWAFGPTGTGPGWQLPAAPATASHTPMPVERRSSQAGTASSKAYPTSPVADPPSGTPIQPGAGGASSASDGAAVSVSTGGASPNATANVPSNHESPVGVYVTLGIVAVAAGAVTWWVRRRG